jgi:hypothetical protein
MYQARRRNFNFDRDLNVAIIIFIVILTLGLLTYNVIINAGQNYIKQHCELIENQAQTDKWYECEAKDL